MTLESPTESAAEAAQREGGVPQNPFTAADVAAILRERGWLDAEPTSGAEASPQGNAFPARLKPCPDGAGVAGDSDLGMKSPASEGAGYNTPGLDAWLADAAALLGPHAADRNALAELLGLIFQYDAGAILRSPESHVVLAREGAREVVRELAHLVLEGPEVDSDRFKEIIAALKERLRFRGRELFHPIRLALAGRAGEGELDRVILLLDGAARWPFCARVKSTRQRILEFCAALD